MMAVKKMPTKRFLYVTEVDLSEDNGPGINEREFVNALLRDDASEVVCLAPYPRNPEIHFEPRIEYVKNYQSSRALFWPLYSCFLISNFLRIIALHRRHRFSAFIFRLGRIPIAPFLFSKFSNIPVILKTLAKYQMFSENENVKSSIRNKMLFPLYKSTIRKAVISDTVSSNYIEWLQFKFGVSKDKLFFVPNGVNTEVFSSGNRDSARKRLGLDYYEFVIGYVGAITKLRHIEVLIESYRKIETKRNVGLVLVGGGDKGTNFRSLVERAGIAKKVHFIGKVPYAKVPDFLQAFDVAVDLTVVPMDVGGNVLSASYSQKIPQYLACGLPVIAWDTEENKFLKEEKIGEIVQLGNKDMVSKSILKLIDLNDKEKQEMRERSRSYAKEHFEISKLVARRVDVWKRVLFSD
jgi:glycosyltransferase involved in cell wall biosynthesis